MHSRRLATPFVLLILFFLASACQKDADVKEPVLNKTSIAADSSVFAAPGNFLAASGTLTIRLNDSAYTFDAATDSIAFINVRVDDQTHYFGVTAINKAHTMSFGISSAGFANVGVEQPVAGGQFLLSADKKPGVQLSLSKFQQQKDFGNIDILKYNQEGVLAKGSFYTFLAKDDQVNSPYYRVEGSFDLKLK